MNDLYSKDELVVKFYSYKLDIFINLYNLKDTR